MEFDPTAPARPEPAAEARPFRVGVDLGGTKTEVVALTRDGTELVRRRVATPSDYDAIVLTVRDLVASVDAELGRCDVVGLGTPGSLRPATGRMQNANTTALNGRPLDLDLAHALGRPVLLENDANCFALSEATDGAARGASSVFGVILGTGVGGGLVLGGHLVRGPNALAGEWGHNPLPWSTAWERPGPACYCGKRGCIETWLSGSGLTREMLLRSGHDLAAHEVATLAGRGDPDAQAALDLYIDRLARALATVINVVDPEVIVLGGGLSNLEVLYREVPRRWSHWAFVAGGPSAPREGALVTRLVRARWGDSSGVRGAARLVAP
ncbi:MAG: ROK family protein [Deltaproteobacteria bacterium]|nr:ROK family protein [Deltaproteobacteria bacterium]